MDGGGRWEESHDSTYIDFENNKYFEMGREESCEITELYKDLDDKGRVYRFFHLIIGDKYKHELIVRVVFERYKED